MAGNTGSRYNFPPHDIPRHDSPLFDRTGSDEYTQLQDARKVTNHLQQRVHDLETRNQFLEYQLEDDATKYMEKETDCVSIERIWKAKCEVIENEISTWKRQFEAQQLKGDRVREHLSHTERELYGMLQRKYELIRGPGGRPTGASVSTISSKKPSWDNIQGKQGVLKLSNSLRSPGSTDELSTTPGRASNESKQRQMLANLSDFLGL